MLTCVATERVAVVKLFLAIDEKELVNGNYSSFCLLYSCQFTCFFNFLCGVLTFRHCSIVECINMWHFTLWFARWLFSLQSLIETTLW